MDYETTFLTKFFHYNQLISMELRCGWDFADKDSSLPTSALFPSPTCKTSLVKFCSRYPKVTKLIKLQTNKAMTNIFRVHD